MAILNYGHGSCRNLVWPGTLSRRMVDASAQKNVTHPAFALDEPVEQAVRVPVRPLTPVWLPASGPSAGKQPYRPRVLCTHQQEKRSRQW